MARLPQVGGDKNSWGGILNEFLGEAHLSDGSLRPDTVGSAQLKTGAVTRNAIANGAVDEQQLAGSVRDKLDTVASGVADGAVTTNKLANGAVTPAKLSGLGEAHGPAVLNANGVISDAQLPARLNDPLVSSVAGRSGAVTLTPADVGLGAVNNTSDLAKPVSSATQTALNGKADLASPAFTGTPTAPTLGVANSSAALATTAFVSNLVTERLSALVLTEDPDNPGYYTVSTLPPAGEPDVAPLITTGSLAAMTEGESFSQTLSATGTTPISWSIVSGALPAGLSLTPGGVISGTPTASGAFSATVGVMNVAGDSERTFTGSVVSAGTAPTIVTTVLNALTEGINFTQSLDATGTSPRTWTVSEGALPTGLNLSTAGTISGTPTSSGAFSATVTVSKAYGSDSRAFSGSVTAASNGGTVGARVASFGPNGTHWPSNTPLPDATYAYDVEVDPSWTAIQSAITAAPATGNARIRVRPGTMPVGAGNGSTDSPVLSGGPSSRSTKIVVVPRDGYGTVTMSSSSTLANMASSGYSFALQNVALMGFDFSGQGVVLRSCTNFAMAWSTFGVLNVTANAANADNLELVECVLPSQIDSESDHAAVRVANGYAVMSLLLDGCYFAPSYKASGSSAHCDTLQLSGTGAGGIAAITLRDSILFQSSSQVLQVEMTGDMTLDHTAFIGGLRGTGRYPIGSGRHTMTAQNTLWGGAGTSATATDALVMGSISSDYNWSTVASSQCSTQTSTPSGWTVNTAYDGQSTLQTNWLNEATKVLCRSYTGCGSRLRVV